MLPSMILYTTRTQIGQLEAQVSQVQQDVRLLQRNNDQQEVFLFLFKRELDGYKKKIFILEFILFNIICLFILIGGIIIYYIIFIIEINKTVIIFN